MQPFQLGPKEEDMRVPIFDTNIELASYRENLENEKKKTRPRIALEIQTTVERY